MGEGGAIATNDEEAYNWLKKARHHGISKDGWKRYEEGGSWRYDIEFVGWKCNPSDILASILIAQLGKTQTIDRERERVVKLYNLFLGQKRPGLHLYPIMVTNQDEFIAYMAKNGVQCSVHFQPLHLMTAFKPYTKNLINTETFGAHMVSLPLYPGLQNYEIEQICKLTKASKLLLES
jgi:dTDP-4-amino-4,6-dideoxygalactose transaminase